MMSIAGQARNQASRRLFSTITTKAATANAAASSSDTLVITRPDDWHLHVRDGAGLQSVVPHTAQVFGRAIIMPNLVPPVTSAAQAIEYKNRITSATPANSSFQPLMTLYLTDNTTPDDVMAAKEAGVIAFKLYPAGATTNSDSGVTDWKKCLATLQTMDKVK
jgi:dihydroorotase